MAATNWTLQTWLIDEEIIPDPANPLAMKKRNHAIAERTRIQDTTDSSESVGATADEITFYVGTEEQTAPSGSGSDWALVSKQVDPVQPGTPMVKLRVHQRWEAWGEWAIYVPTGL